MIFKSKLWPGLLFFIQVGCISAADAEEHIAREAYTYTSIRNFTEEYSIISGSKDTQVYLGDVELGATVKGIGEIQKEKLLSFQYPVNFTFYLPNDFSAISDAWTHDNCNYEVLSRSIKKIPVTKKSINYYIIEQSCSVDDHKVRFEYSDQYGIQSFAFVEYDGRDTSQFRIKDQYSLFGAKVGFFGHRAGN